MHPAARPAVVGVADHSGWANLVTIGTDGRGLLVVDRRRCDLVEPDVPRQPYHAADGLDDSRAEALVARVTDAARSGAAAALASLVADIRAEHRLVALTLRTGGGRPQSAAIADVLASHAAMHSAEGALYREALADAARDLGIDVVVHGRDDAEAGAASALGVSGQRLSAAIVALGRSVGPPWQKEHRQAAAAALGELARRAAVHLDP